MKEIILKFKDDDVNFIFLDLMHQYYNLNDLDLATFEDIINISITTYFNELYFTDKEFRDLVIDKRLKFSQNLELHRNTYEKFLMYSLFNCGKGKVN